MTDEHLNPLREKLMKKYRFKFDAYGESPIYAATLNAYLKNPRPFLDAGIRLVPKTIRSKKIPRGVILNCFCRSTAHPNSQRNGNRMPKNDNPDKLNLDKLTDEQRKIVDKQFDYLMYLDYLAEDVPKPIRQNVISYRESFIVQIAAMIDVFEKRNWLKEKGFLK